MGLLVVSWGLVRRLLIEVPVVSSWELLVRGPCVMPLTWCRALGSLQSDLRQLGLSLEVSLLPRKFLAPCKRILDLGLEERRRRVGPPVRGP